MLKVSLKRQLIYLQIAVLASAFVIAVILIHSRPLQIAEQGLLSTFYGVHGGIKASDKIVIVAIDDESLSKIGSWPWKEKAFLKLLEKLRGNDAAIIAIDTTFDDQIIFDNRRFLADLQKNRDLVIGYSFYSRREDIPLDKRQWAAGADSFDMLTAQMIASVSSPSEELPSQAGVMYLPRNLRLSSGLMGFTNLFMERDGLIIKVPLIARYRNILLPSIGLVAAGRYEKFTPLLRKNSKGILSGVAIGKRNIPINSSGMMTLNFTGGRGAYKQISASDILDDKISGEDVQGRLILIGPTFSDPENFVKTPFGKNVPTIEVWANAIDNIVFSAPLRCVTCSGAVTIGIIVVLTLLLAFVLPRLKILWSLVFIFGFAPALVVNGYIFFMKSNIWFAIATPVICSFFIFFCVTIYRLLTEERMRRNMKFTYGGALRENAIDEMVASDCVFPKNGEKRRVTVMVLGIREFEKILGEIAEHRLMSFVETVFREVSACLAKEDAYIKRLGNDRIMAIFGAPVFRSDHAQRTCRAALAIRNEISTRRLSWKNRYSISSLRLMMGVQTGDLIIGELKVNGRREFSVIGESLITSSVFSDLNRTYKTSVIVGSETVESTKEWNSFRPLDVVRRKNQKSPIEVYELLGRKGVVTPYIEIYMRAYEAYRAKNYDAAIKLAEDLLKRMPHDGPTKVLLSRSKSLMQKPPEKDWDGARVI